MQTDFVTMADLWNGLTKTFGTPIALQGAQAVLSEGHVPTNDAVHLKCDMAGVPMAFAISDFPFAQQTGTNIDISTLSTLPESLRNGLYLGIADALADLLPADISSNINNMELGCETEMIETWLRADIDMGAGGVAVCSFGATRNAFCHILKTLFPDGPGGIPGQPGMLLDQIPAQLALTMGHHDLSLDALKGLMVGDIILAKIAPNIRALEHAKGNFILTHHAEGDTQQWQIKEFVMTDEATPEVAETSENSDVQSIGEVPVRLSFATQTLTMSVAQIQELTPGAVVPLETQSSEPGTPVRIMANGTIIGDGHLVQIEDQLAVRVAGLGKQEA